MKLIEKFRAASKKAVSASADLQMAVEELRSELFRLMEERRQVVDAPKSREEIAATISAQFDRLEAEALDRLIPETVASDRPYVAAPDVELQFRVRHAEAPGLYRLAGVGALCVLGLRPTMEAALVERVVAASPVPGISVPEREAKLRKVDAEIDAIERAEEQLIREAETVGIVVHRRPDARPEIFLAESLDAR